MGVNFMLPGMYEKRDLNVRLLDLIKEHPEFFIDGLNIAASYGNFQFCLWDGGRIFGAYEQASKEIVQEVCHVYNDIYNVPIRFVFTNNQLQEKHYYDRFCNMVLDICHNGHNEVVVNDEKLKEYIQAHYPGYSFISSTTKCLVKPEDALAELKKEEYKFVCLDYNNNHNFALLNQLSEEEKNRTEFLVNAICASGCPSRKEHYRLNSLFHINYGKKYGMDYCPLKYNTLYPDNCDIGRANNISPQEIQEIYLPQGFHNFKLEGRTLPVIENIENYVKYMVKPEYQQFVAVLLGDRHR